MLHRITRMLSSSSVLSKVDLATLNFRCSFVSQQAENPYFKKYAEKIAAFQKTSPEEFQRRMEKREAKPSCRSEAQKTLPSAPKSNISGSGIKSLGSIVNFENFQNLEKEAIESLWKEYHKDKDGLYAVLPEEAGRKILSKLKEFPTFLFPLPRAQGYEFIMSQFLGNTCHLTPLVSYQAHKENAPVSFTLTYFSELLETKGIVLMRGEFDENIFKAHEAQCLTNQLHLYYSGDDAKKNKLLWQFNKQPDTFRHMDLIAELEFSLGRT